MSGVPLRDALALPALRNARVLAGAAGLGHAVRYVNVMEVPDSIDWVKPDELLLTTAYPLRDDRAGLADLVPRLADRGLTEQSRKPIGVSRQSAWTSLSPATSPMPAYCASGHPPSAGT